jgi:hypothetical protein
MEGLIKASDLLIAARMGLSESLDLRFVHGFRPSPRRMSHSR